MRPPEQLRRFVATIGQAEALDAPIAAVQGVTGRLLQSDRVKRVLSGAPLGHRLHPMLTDIPIGCWTSASVLDVLAWRSGPGERASPYCARHRVGVADGGQRHLGLE